MICSHNISWWALFAWNPICTLVLSIIWLVLRIIHQPYIQLQQWTELVFVVSWRSKRMLLFLSEKWIQKCFFFFHVSSPVVISEIVRFTFSSHLYRTPTSWYPLTYLSILFATCRCNCLGTSMICWEFQQNTSNHA